MSEFMVKWKEMAQIVQAVEPKLCMVDNIVQQNEQQKITLMTQEPAANSKEIEFKTMNKQPDLTVQASCLGRRSSLSPPTLIQTASLMRTS